MSQPLMFGMLNKAQNDAVNQWEMEHNSNNEYECADNFRYAVVGNAEHERLYDEIVARGCCGFCDVVLECSDGSKVMFGFNYGH